MAFARFSQPDSDVYVKYYNYKLFVHVRDAYVKRSLDTMLVTSTPFENKHAGEKYTFTKYSDAIHMLNDLRKDDVRVPFSCINTLLEYQNRLGDNV